MFKKECKSRTSHTAFITTYAVIYLDVIEVLNNVLLIDGTGRYIVVIPEQMLEFGDITPNGTRRIMFSRKEIRKLYQQALCFLIEGYFS